MTTYNYNLSNDFINGINPTCLDRGISDYGFPITLSSVNIEYETDTVSIIFETDLSVTDKEDLDVLISAHNPLTTCEVETSASIGGTKVDFVLANQSGLEYIYNKTISWAVATSFIFEGSLNWVPQKFSVISSLKDTATGSVRLYDQTNNNEICSIDWTNTSKGIVSTETFSNIPNIPALIEVQYKTDTKNNDDRLHYVALY